MEDTKKNEGPGSRAFRELNELRVSGGTEYFIYNDFNGRVPVKIVWAQGGEDFSVLHLVGKDWVEGYPTPNISEFDMNKIPAAQDVFEKMVMEIMER